MIAVSNRSTHESYITSYFCRLNSLLLDATGLNQERSFFSMDVPEDLVNARPLCHQFLTEIDLYKQETRQHIAQTEQVMQRHRDNAAVQKSLGPSISAIQLNLRCIESFESNWELFNFELARLWEPTMEGIGQLAFVLAFLATYGWWVPLLFLVANFLAMVASVQYFRSCVSRSMGRIEVHKKVLQRNIDSIEAWEESNRGKKAEEREDFVG